MEFDQGEAAKRLKQYLDIRAKLKELDDAHEDRRKPLVEIQNLLSGWILQFIEQAGLQNLSVKGIGTAYRSVRETASLSDPDVFMRFVRQNELFDLMDRRANSKACRDYMEANKVDVPGVRMSAVVTVGVQKAPAEKAKAS